MRIALLGAGRIGAAHARVIAADPRVDRLTIADVDADRASTVARAVGGHAAADAASAIADADALVIATSTTTHAELIRAGIARGIPVF